ncbi:MAG: septal ring lytic transglycosylase RlpA family protein [Candidatus Omnitrophica bacterium]|nr:septal ring lytic transglycosylase RlpA family protein [Candidatus Omnitrophota bacterium]
MKRLFMFIILSIILFNGIAQAKEKSLITRASWYSKNDPTDPFEHKQNSDGSKFNENALTCAMRSRDFGKYYRVTNLANGKSIVVKHCDFGPAKEYKGRKLNRDIDLSKKAFESIANLDIGVIKVRVEGVINVAYK